MTADKLKQYIGLFGGLLGAILLFLRTLNIEYAWFNESTIDGLTGVLLAAIPFVLVAYGVWKNSYVITDKAKQQEKVLKRNGLK